ncbi:MAG: serine aminopeptidase domain-containing protein [Polyangiaceae bacterium]
MKPAFFGHSSRPLYGVHEPPRPGSPRRAAVLLSYPGVQEYNMAHWAFRRLSGMLAREGFHVLRFDWSGSGDSWGETSDGTLNGWIEDAALAMSELRDVSGRDAAAIVGMRLGAAITAVACGRGLAVDQLVLWEPVVRGRDYIVELETLDERENARLLHPMRAMRTELVGFPFSQKLRDDLGTIDLSLFPPKNAKKVSIIAHSERSDHLALHESILQAGGAASYACVPEDPSATNAGKREEALLTTRALVAIVDTLLGKALS